jgi:hypothetical protein
MLSRRNMIRFIKRPLNWLLLSLAVVSTAAIFLGHENPFARIVLCAHVPCPHFSNSHAWEKIAYDLGIGSIVSLLFYWLVVMLPESAKRRRIRDSFALHFRQFKEDVIATILTVTDGSYEYGFHQELVDQTKFREYFKQKGEGGNERWYAFYNNMTASQLQEILMHLEVLRTEILFTMAAVDIEDKEVLEFMKRFSANILRYRSTPLEYASMKSFSNFIWEIFAGFSLVTGYMQRDYFVAVIDDL